LPRPLSAVSEWRAASATPTLSRYGPDQFVSVPFSRIVFFGKWWNKRQSLTFLHSIGRRRIMLYWALVFLVVAIIAGALGFGGIAGTSAGIAQILFFVFLAFLVISLLAGLFRRAS
jgi:uncharacterized membrane protein YtjA (UPF0391 family)